MIKIIFPALTAGALIGCGGENAKTSDTRKKQTKVDLPSSETSLSETTLTETTSSFTGDKLRSVKNPVGQQKPVALHRAPSAVLSPTPLIPPQAATPVPPRPATPMPPPLTTQPASPSPDESVEVEFMDEFDDGEPHNRRGVPERPPSPTGTYNSNLVGEAVLQLINGDVAATVDYVIDQLITLLAMSRLDRNTGLFNSNLNHMQWWTASRGPELLQHVIDNRDCGIGVDDVNSPRTKCYLLMMIGTHAPVQAAFKPRDVAVHIGLSEFCRSNTLGIATELKIRAKNPVDYDGWGHDGLPDSRMENEGVARSSINDAFAATWLSFCPNLVTQTEPTTRIMVFKHAMYRMQIASLHTDGEVDQRYSQFDVERDQAFVSVVDTLVTDRVQRLRRPIDIIRFSGAEIDAIGRGVKEDWATEVGKQIFRYSLSSLPAGVAGDRDRELFVFPDSNEYVLMKDLSESVGLDRGRVRKYYKAAGRYVGWMLINGYQIPEDLSLMFYAKLMGRKIGWEAIKVYDSTYYDLFRRCLHTPDHTCPYIGIYAVHYRNPEHDNLVDPWPIDEQERRNILNDAATNMATAAPGEEQYRVFSEGIYDVVPKHIFECGITTKDFRLLLVGFLNINAQEMVDQLTFQNYSVQDVQIRWLSAYLLGLNQNQLQKFLQFVTGKRRPGFGGFRNDPIQIKKMYTLQRPDDPQELPAAHVCYRQLELPPYLHEATVGEKMTYVLDLPLGFGIF
jgi:hypothetical protein